MWRGVQVGSKFTSGNSHPRHKWKMEVIETVLDWTDWLSVRRTKARRWARKQPKGRAGFMSRQNNSKSFLAQGFVQSRTRRERGELFAPDYNPGCIQIRSEWVVLTVVEQKQMIIIIILHAHVHYYIWKKKFFWDFPQKFSLVGIGPRFSSFGFTISCRVLLCVLSCMLADRSSSGGHCWPIISLFCRKSTLSGRSHSV